MFLSVYKSTIKNILRSKSFWIILFIVFIVVVQAAISGQYANDRAEEYVLSYNDYVQMILNTCCATLLMYALPIFTILTVVLVLNRDYGDDFFEIEKAANMSLPTYFMGRLSALLSLNALALIVFHTLCVHLYVFIRNGVDGLNTIEYLIDSTIRILRIDFCVALPTVVFYLGLALAVGTLFKNGIVSAIVSIGYVIFFYVSFLMFRWRIAPDYFNYFSPIPYNLRRYFHFYDTTEFEGMVNTYDLSIEKALFCIAFLVGIAVLCSVVSYLKIRKRSI